MWINHLPVDTEQLEWKEQTDMYVKVCTAKLCRSCVEYFTLASNLSKGTVLQQEQGIPKISEGTLATKTQPQYMQHE